MALVVWVYAGGGQAEFSIVPFLERHFPSVTFFRRTPERWKPGPRPGVPIAYGATGKHLAQVISENLTQHWKGQADLLLIFDDLDCDEFEMKARLLNDAASASLIARNAKAELPRIIVGLAIPELEAWVIADWKNTFEKAFGRCHHALRHELVLKGVALSNVEGFDCFCGTSKYRKISVVLQEAFDETCIPLNRTSDDMKLLRYSKDTDTQRLMGAVNGDNVARTCPKFGTFWRELKQTLVDDGIVTSPGRV